jgi:class 3 adenylate cyclase
VTGRPHSTFIFADLVGFTSLTERCGNEAASSSFEG